jgi:hypothetical protein
MHSPLNRLSTPMNTGFPLLNDMLFRACGAELSRGHRQPGRTRGSLLINLDVRRARRQNPSG